MKQELLDRLRAITPEERDILDGQGGIQQNIYTSRAEFIVDSEKLLSRGKVIEIRPHTRFAHFPRHRHNYVEMVYMCAGNTTHIINDTTEIRLGEGDLLFLNQHVYHEILPAGMEDLAVNFILLPEFFDRPVSMIERENVLRDFFIAALSGTNDAFGYLHIRAHGIVPVENLLESMIWTLLEYPHGMNSINQTSMGLLLMYLSLFADSITRGTEGGNDQNLVFTILNYIDTHYKNGTLAEAAELTALPAYTVSRLLKRYTGSNFKELLQKRKLEQAAYLLANSTAPIEAVMESIGYENSSYFYRRFRQKYGCSPNVYRTQTR